MTANHTTSSDRNSFDRVRSNTSTAINARIDENTIERLHEYANQTESSLTKRIHELEREWDTERVLEANASILAFIGLILGLTVNQNWFWLTGIVLPFLFQHAIQGWCPPLPLIRRLGVRTRQEIDQEKYALKVLRGDFAEVSPSEADTNTRTTVALQAVKR